MKVLATYSIKGGVGKTTAAVNLATTAARRGWRVMLWDLDPQGAATYLMRVRPRVKGGGRSLVRERRMLVDVARATDVPNLDLVPADFRYRHLDLELDGVKRPRTRLRSLIARLDAEYDWVFVDCAPSISLVSEGVFEAAHGLLVPIVPSVLSTRTVDQLTRFLTPDQDRKRSRPPEVIGFLSMVDRRRKLHREVAERLPVERPGLLAATHIPAASIVERMGVERRALTEFAPRATVSECFAALWAEIETRWPEP